MRVLLNGINALGAGGRTVISSVVPCVANAAPDITFDLVLPADQGYEYWHSTQNLNIHLMKRPANRFLGRFADIYLDISRWSREFNSDMCFTLGDLGPIHLKIPHIVFLHQPLLVYRNSDFERLWAPTERWKFRYTRWHFERMAPHCAALTVQTPVMAKRLHQTYNIPMDKIHVVSSALPAHLQQASGGIYPNIQMMATDKPCRLLFLAAGYEHKNHYILPALVEILRQRKLADKVQIFVTLDATVRSYERDLLALLEPYSDCVTNLGRLAPDQVKGAYKAANALFIPTLVESFGLIYLEAMACNCPILTSDRDFARWMCDDLARYFDPLDPASIAQAIERFIANGPPEAYRERAIQRLERFPSSWDAVAREYVEILRQCA